MERNTIRCYYQKQMREIPWSYHKLTFYRKWKNPESLCKRMQRRHQTELSDVPEQAISVSTWLTWTFREMTTDSGKLLPMTWDQDLGLNLRWSLKNLLACNHSCCISYPSIFIFYSQWLFHSLIVLCQVTIDSRMSTLSTSVQHGE